jgi:hypothetical protein
MLWIVEFNFEREWELQRASMRDGFIYRSLFDNQAWNSSGNVHVHGRLGWLFMHCISHVSKILLILGWYRWLLNVIFFFIRYEWRMIWFYSLFFSFIQQGAFYTKIWCLHASSREAFRAIWVLLLLRAEFGLWNCMES